MIPPPEVIELIHFDKFSAQDYIAKYCFAGLIFLGNALILLGQVYSFFYSAMNKIYNYLAMYCFPGPELGAELNLTMRGIICL